MVKYAPRKVYIRESGGYVELSYTEFCRCRESDQTYMDKLFIPIQGRICKYFCRRYQVCGLRMCSAGNERTQEETPRDAVRAFQTEDFRNIPAGQYKWVHHNLERMTDEQVAYIDSLPESAVFQADGWVYLVQHQYRPGSYEVIECRHKFEEHWKRYTPKEYWDAPRRRMVFGHTHRQCVHILGEGKEWLNPGSVSYHRLDDPDKDARYMVIINGNIQMRSLPYPREPLLKETLHQLKAGRMAEQEMRYFFYYFGDAPDFDELSPSHLERQKSNRYNGKKRRKIRWETKKA